MGTITDFSIITACGECCVGCRKKAVGLCEGCIESEGHCKEWNESGGCPIFQCAKQHHVQFCGLCQEFPCKWLVQTITWNPDVVEQLSTLAGQYRQAQYRIRRWNPHTDRDLILSYNARANFACAGADIQAQGFEAFRAEWLGKDNAQRIWTLALDASADDRNVCVMILDRQDKPIGFFWTMTEEISPGVLCMQVNDVFVEEEFRRHGIAYDLFCHAQEHAKRHGIQVMRSGTGASNVSSRALHEKFGFSVCRYEYEKLLSRENGR